MSGSASSLLAALARRHQGDVFVDECKNGPTYTASHRRFDAWVLLKTWSPITTIGYEIKASKSDWRRDEKIGEYMGLCHQLYLVAPKGIIPPDELPAAVGLLEPVGDGTRLVTRRKAAWRAIEIPVSLLVYVLMCRVQVQREHGIRTDQPSGQWRVNALKEWIASKKDRRALHYAVSAKIREQFDAQEHEIKRVADRIRELEHVERRIIELGFDPAADIDGWCVSKRMQQIGKAIDPWLLLQLKQTANDLGRVHAALEELRTEKPVEDVA